MIKLNINLKLVVTILIAFPSHAAVVLKTSNTKIIVQPASTGGADFQTRCNAPGVVRCVGFDQVSEVFPTSDTSGDDWGRLYGTMKGAKTKPVLDTTQKSSGNSSLLFTITSSNSDSSGAYFTNFSDVTTKNTIDPKLQFDSGEEFYVQWRQRFDSTYVSMNLSQYGNAGWKQAIVGAGDLPAPAGNPGCTYSTSTGYDKGGYCVSSCSPLETVTQSYYHDGFPIVYNSCEGSSSTQQGSMSGSKPGGTEPYNGFYLPFNGSDFKLQNSMPSPYCLYSQNRTNNGCFKYYANEWITFQMRIKIGQRTNDYFKASYVELWIAREGKPSVLVISWGPYDLAAGKSTYNLQYGKVWLTPYNSNNNGNNNATVPSANTWYDELIISKQKIADPK